MTPYATAPSSDGPVGTTPRITQQSGPSLLVIADVAIIHLGPAGPPWEVAPPGGAASTFQRAHIFAPLDAEGMGLRNRLQA